MAMFEHEHPISKDEGMHMLRERGALEAVITFSGGNDEGGVDEMYLVMPGENGSDPVQVSVEETWAGREWDPSTQTYKPGRELTSDESDDNDLVAILEAPVYAEYSGFAGDFDVSGTVTWNVAKDTITMQRTETVWTELEPITW